MLLLKIISKLKELRQDFQVLVVGDGNLLNRMKEETQKQNLTNEIVFLGKIQNTAEIYEISDLTINCSLKEGLALTAYESLSMGVPVISSDVGGQKELITEKTGEIIELMQDEKDIYNEDLDKNTYDNDNSKDLMKIIRFKYKKLSKGQKLIAEYILENYDKAAFMTASKLGISVGVSESTVVRFANELGFSGYPKLQKALLSFLHLSFPLHLRYPLYDILLVILLALIFCYFLINH